MQNPALKASFSHLFKRGILFAIICWLGWAQTGSAATIIVTNGAPSGAGTLRSALTNAHNGDVITFAVTGIITNSVGGGLKISNSISIFGPGTNLLTITATNWNPAFQLINGVTSSISGLTFYRCTGAINNSANLTVSNCLFTGCYRGGGINNSSNLTVNGCTFTDCRGGYGAGYFSENIPGTAGGAGANGGAIVNSGIMSAVNCQFLNNTAGWGGDGTPGRLAIYPNQSNAGGNGGNGGSGGAIYDTGLATFTNCTFSGNTSGAGGAGADGGSGGITFEPVTQTYPGPGRNGGNGGNAGNGSAVWSVSGGKFIGCTFYNNFAEPGGNGGNGGNAVMPNPGFYHYNGGDGGYAGNAGSGTLFCTGSCSVIACTFYNNSTGNGGNGGNGGTGMNSSAYGNTLGSGANAGNGGSGGAIYGSTNAPAGFTLQNVLTAANACGYAGSPGSAGARIASAPGPTGTNGLGGIDGTGPDLSGKFISNSHNFISLGDGSTGFTNNVKNDIVGSGSAIDAMIAALADNHGPIQTCALLPGSPALDAGDDTLLASNIVQDARGYARKSGAHVDIGAFEYQWLTGQFLGRTGLNPDGLLRVSVTNTPGALFTVYGSDDLTLPTMYWPALGHMTEASPGDFEWVDPDSIYYDHRFYLLSSP